MDPLLLLQTTKRQEGEGLLQWFLTRGRGVSDGEDKVLVWLSFKRNLKV
jgi:hypothetical protein